MSAGDTPFSNNSRTAQVLDQFGIPVQQVNRKVLANGDYAPQAAGAIAAGDNPVFSINGTNAADADGTLDTTGYIQLNSSAGGTADDEVVMLLNSNVQKWTPTVADEPALFARIKTDADDATEVQYGIGIGSDDDGDAAFDGGDGELDPNAATAADTYLGFTFDTDDSDTNWQIDIIDDGGTVVTADTGVKFEADTVYQMMVGVDALNRPYFLIQKEGEAARSITFTEPFVFGGADFSDGLTGTTNVVGPFLGVSNLTTAVRDLFVHSAAFSAKL